MCVNKIKTIEGSLYWFLRPPPTAHFLSFFHRRVAIIMSDTYIFEKYESVCDAIREWAIKQVLIYQTNKQTRVKMCLISLSRDCLIAQRTQFVCSANRTVQSLINRRGWVGTGRGTHPKLEKIAVECDWSGNVWHSKSCYRGFELGGKTKFDKSLYIEFVSKFKMVVIWGLGCGKSLTEF